MRFVELALVASVAAAAVPSAAGQTIDEIRQDVSESLRQSKFASGLSGLVLLAQEVVLSGASYDVDDEESTQITSIVLPFARSLDAFEGDTVRLYVEGAIGYTRATGELDDIYSGELPAATTAVDATWESWTGSFGAGPEVDLTDELRGAAILSIGVARLDNRTDYEGPGADLSAALFDGLAFNWDAWALLYGTGVRLDWERSLGERRAITVTGRLDARWTQVLDADDPAQEFTTRLQVATARAEYRTPTGLSLGAFPVDARVSAGARRLIEGDVFGIREIYELGLQLEFLTGERIPIASGVHVSGAAFFGDDVSGWTAGIGLSF